MAAVSLGHVDYSDGLLVSCAPSWFIKGSRMLKPIACTVSVLVGCVTASLAIAQGSTAQTQPPPPPTTPAGHPDTAPRQLGPPSAAEEKKALYALGVLLGRNLETFSLTPAEFATVRQGFSDGYHHTASVKDAQAQLPQVQALEQTRVRKAGDIYLAKAAAAPGATKTASGLVFQSVKEGSGASPTRTDRVKVNYEGRLIDGTVFDSSALHGGQPATLAVSGVIACWTEALQKMKVGGKAHIVCPPAIAYGERGSPPRIRPGSTLDFDVELLDILPPMQPAVPGSVPAPAVPAAPGSPGTPASPGAAAKPGAPAAPVSTPAPGAPPRS